MSRITGLSTHDLRFPTADALDGSDAMNPDPNYSAAYVILETDGVCQGHGLTFTIGRGNEICVAAIEALRPLLIGLDMDWVREDMSRFWWLVSEMSPAEIFKLVDFRYITDVITTDEALDILSKAEDGKAERIAKLDIEGYPCYTTSAGWLGYSNEKLRHLCREARTTGFTHTKFKVGHNLEDDIRRLTIARQELGEDMSIMIDANQVWEVDQAISWVKVLAFARPLFIEESTSPDDVAGHKAIREGVAPIKVEKYGLPVWPHAGGVGLCEYVQHLSMIDYVAISCEKDSKRIEFIDHLHAHFLHPYVVKNGVYHAPRDPGFSIEMYAASIESQRFHVAHAERIPPQPTIEFA